MVYSVPLKDEKVASSPPRRIAIPTLDPSIFIGGFFYFNTTDHDLFRIHSLQTKTSKVLCGSH